MRGTRPVHVCEAHTFKPGDPEPEGYIDRVEWHRAQQRAGLRQGRCPVCSRWVYPFQEHAHDDEPAPSAAARKGEGEER